MIEKVFEQQRLKEENRYLRSEVLGKYTVENIISQSPKMERVFQLIANVAMTDSTVMIQGETGTGKELVARAIHFGSKRKRKNFVAINCGALADNLLESELFGHEKGPSPEQFARKSANLNSRIRARCFWMKLAMYRQRCR